MADKATPAGQLRDPLPPIYPLGLIEVSVNLLAAMAALKASNLRAHTDDIGERMHELVYAGPAGADPDQLACYASNGLQGPLALLRELGRLLPAPKGKRR